ncbi:hypothetical protein G9A89_019990 [Geosiphon pyriformis]|nr:hypothetical protein G9A89_019990 [Geosiphon pyriformis]
MPITTNYCQYHHGMTKERKEEKKNLPEKLTKVIGIIMTKNVLIAAKNCHQWAYAVVTMKNILPQPNSTATHDNKSCLTCGETLLDKKMWNNISG